MLMGLHTSKHKWGKVSFCRSWTIMDHRDAADYLTIQSLTTAMRRSNVHLERTTSVCMSGQVWWQLMSTWFDHLWYVISNIKLAYIYICALFNHIFYLDDIWYNLYIQSVYHIHVLWLDIFRISKNRWSPRRRCWKRLGRCRGLEAGAGLSSKCPELNQCADTDRLW